IIFFLFGAYFSRYRTNKYIQQREIALRKGNLFVIAAFYGVNDTWKDVTQTVNQLAQNQQHSFMVNNRNLMNGGDPAPYIAKQLVCVYTNNRIFNLKSFSEGEMAKLE
ncbi:MAG: hypothetical protein JNJ78_02105, partial [Anaerolineae bacterium]|nr:hypothetical protein [Anaerolineae bacterium]